MVRFIIYHLIILTNIFIEIYIPLWLDLLYAQAEHKSLYPRNLHSTMVRFIIFKSCKY